MRNPQPQQTEPEERNAISKEFSIGQQMKLSYLFGKGRFMKGDYVVAGYTSIAERLVQEHLPENSQIQINNLVDSMPSEKKKQEKSALCFGKLEMLVLRYAGSNMNPEKISLQEALAIRTAFMVSEEELHRTGMRGFLSPELLDKTHRYLRSCVALHVGTMEPPLKDDANIMRNLPGVIDYLLVNGLERTQHMSHEPTRLFYMRIINLVQESDPLNLIGGEIGPDSRAMLIGVISTTRAKTRIIKSR